MASILHQLPRTVLEELAQAVREIFPNVKAVSNAYGLTEAGTVFTMIGGAENSAGA